MYILTYCYDMQKNMRIEIPLKSDALKQYDYHKKRTNLSSQVKLFKQTLKRIK